MFYVYEWFIKETNEVIYVGKGTGLRYRVRKHNKSFNEFLRRFNCDSRIVKEFDNEEEAFAFEFDRIRYLRSIGQCVCNIRDGGFGGSTDWWTEELREAYSKNNVMKSSAQRKRMQDNNPMKDKDVAEKTNAKKRIAVIINDTEYPSVKSAAEKFSVSVAAINSWCVNGMTPDGQICYYKDYKHAVRIHINNGQAKSVIYKAERFNSTMELAKYINVSNSTVSRWCRQGRDSYGNSCRYENETEVIDSGLKQKNIPVTVNGIWYPSKEEAARKIGISSYKITRYLEGKASNSEYICEYGNQQPSRENADNSIPEGSETNR